MDMPITIIVTLFVGLIVGALVIGFAENILFASQTEFINLTGKQGENGFFEVKQITDNQVALLVKDCYKNSYGKSLNSQICYMIHGENSVLLNSEEVNRIAGINAYVSPESAKFFLVKWNVKENTVEVTT